MSFNKLFKYHKKQFIIIFFIIILLQYFKIPYNINLINKRSYEVRMFYSHGRCDKESYQFITTTLKEFNLTDEFPLKYHTNTPNIYGLLLPHKKTINNKYVFILNYAENEETRGIEDKIFIIDEERVDLKEYSLKKRNGNCYFWVKND
jgi:hypothetical protein